ncbi:hypothetical protein [Paractinoplanes toevensis]|uniref:Uncharacterized protein n=1 Tax=Paractinoplanes toevensis TaxID=571911 RepID=A0A920BRD1_9ACTN|nr:hypothetical protein [Actinoplanes toevensis]GIM98234.1 hypothetical protein Ato02nite_100270 [Actinoplanes toevensis]
MIVEVSARPLTQRERAVLEALLATNLENAGDLRRQMADVVVVGVCGCGCPSIDFQHGRGLGMTVQVNAAVRGTLDGLLLYTIEDSERGNLLGGIEWVDAGAANPDEFPSPDLLDIRPT